MKDFLKKYGLHHTWPHAVILLSLHFIHPILGIMWACYGTGYFDGREVSQSQYRKWSNNIFTIAENIEWPDFVSPKIVSVTYLIYIWFVYLKGII